MDKTWRPEGWKNPFGDLHKMDTRDIMVKSRQFGINFLMGSCLSIAHEEGADAILEALFKLASESPTKTFTIDARVVQIL